MSVRLQWRVGAGEEEPAASPGPEAVLPRRAARRFVLTPRGLGWYLAALVCAGALGFGLGRVSEVQARVQDEIGRQVGLETAAWRAADPSLLAATLDPEAPPGWRQAALAGLVPGAAPGYLAELRAVRLLGPDRALATVALRTPAGERLEERLYRAIGGAWYRAPSH